MTLRMVRRGKSASAIGLALLAAATLSAPRAHAAETLTVTLDQATLLKLPEKVSTIVVGNPLIADIAVQSGGLMVVTGKGYGSTNLIVLDRTGGVLMERSIVVRGPNGQTVSVYRGAERETYSCTPDCERRITLGDSPAYFGQTMGQSEARSGSAAASGSRATR